MWKHGDAGWMYRTTATYPASISLFFRNRSSSFFLSLSPFSFQGGELCLLTSLCIAAAAGPFPKLDIINDGGEPRSGRTLRSAQAGMWEISQPSTKSTSGPRDMPGTPQRRRAAAGLLRRRSVRRGSWWNGPSSVSATNNALRQRRLRRIRRWPLPRTWASAE